MNSSVMHQRRKKIETQKGLNISGEGSKGCIDIDMCKQVTVLFVNIFLVLSRVSCILCAIRMQHAFITRTFIIRSACKMETPHKSLFLHVNNVNFMLKARRGS